MDKKSRNWYIFLGVLFLFAICLIPEKSHGGDMGHWERWTGFMLMEGFPYIYDYGQVYPTIFPCNYPPVILYFFQILGWVVADVDKIEPGFKYFKIIPLIFDFLSLALVVFLVKKIKKKWWLPLLLLLNLAFWYNSYCWGQLDGIFTFFVVLSIYFALEQKAMPAIIFYVIALNTKFQAIIFLPVFALSIIPVLWNWRMAGKALISGVVTQTLILLPFICYGTVGDWYKTMSSLVDQYKNVSLNAYNFWHLITIGEDPLYIKDYTAFLWGMTYKNWGLLLFCTYSFFVLLPLLLKCWNALFGNSKFDTSFKQQVYLVAGLCAVAFFFFNTQMHERYAHPAMLMFFIYGLYSRNYLLYGLCSLAYLLNLERVLRYFEVRYDTLIFEKEFIAAIFMSILLLGLWELYRKR